MNREKFDVEMQDYLSGKKTPTDKTVAYQVERYQLARAEYEALTAKVAELETMLTAARERRLVLQGEVNSRATDLEHWMGLEEETDDVRPTTKRGSNGVAVTDKRSVA